MRWYKHIFIKLAKAFQLPPLSHKFPNIDFTMEKHESHSKIHGLHMKEFKFELPGLLNSKIINLRALDWLKSWKTAGKINITLLPWRNKYCLWHKNLCFPNLDHKSCCWLWKQRIDQKMFPVMTGFLRAFSQVSQ